MAKQKKKSTPGAAIAHARHLNQRGGAAEAVRLLEPLRKQLSKHGDYWTQLGIAYASTGRVAAAFDAVGRALALTPRNPEALFCQGTLLLQSGRPGDALALLDALLEQAPDNVPVLTRKTRALLDLGDGPGAEAAARRLVAVQPDTVEPLYLLFGALVAQARYEDAVETADRLLALRPGSPELMVEKGTALLEMGRPEAALQVFAEVPEGQGGLGLPLNRGKAFAALRRFDEAASSFDAARALDPARYTAFAQQLQQATAMPAAGTSALDSRLVYAGYHQNLLENCIWDLREDFAAHFPSVVREAQSETLLFILVQLGLGSEQELQTARAVSQRIADSVTAVQVDDRPPARADRRLRIGYLSPDFRRHAVMSLARKVFAGHDRGDFEVYCYSIHPDRDELTDEVIAGCDHFTDLAELTDTEAAGRIADDGVDILVDLAGYTKHARPAIPAARPAPVQVSYLGYPATTGAPWMDYILADTTLIPGADAAHYSEQVVHLEPTPVPVPGFPEGAQTARSDWGLPDDAVVYCAFQAGYKIEPRIFSTWMDILRKVPESVLWLVLESETMRRRLRRSAKTHGIDPERLVFAAKVSLEEHMARQRLADVFLDTCAYSGFTTVAMALWAALPVVTGGGRNFAARMGASVARAAGLTETIADDLDRYSEIAVELGHDRDHRERIRAGLHARDQLPLFDHPGAVRRLEAAYQRMWQLHCSGVPPKGFQVP